MFTCRPMCRPVDELVPAPCFRTVPAKSIRSLLKTNDNRVGVALSLRYTPPTFMVPLVQKPISSVLEKIRRRKLEVSKQTNFLSQSDVGSISGFSNGEFA